jgi:Na+-transporting NADH:ubiquinone oxidoreductase subunit C
MRYVRDIVFIFIVSFFFTGVTAGVHQLLGDRIRLNEKTRQASQLLDVLGITQPGMASQQQIADLEKKFVKYSSLEGRRVFKAVNEHGAVTGYAFEIGGKGLWGRIDGFVATDPAMQRITGLIFTSHSETPGLGARIEEHWFRDQFKKVRLDSVGQSGNFFHIDRSGSPGENKVDGIAGATITTSSVERFLNRDLREIMTSKDQMGRLAWQSP